MKAPEIDKTVTETKYTINDLPDEVIEFVLSFVSPYEDLHDCMQVCKRWRRSVINVVRVKRRQLLKALSDFNIQWQCPEPIENLPTIAKRYSHSAVVHENSMYVFGGCTNSMTTFNDLWRLDLSRRIWIRPLASGYYPTPKACSSLVCYNDTLILFGGWAYPCSYPFHQSYQLFNELHIYKITEHRWNYVARDSPPPMAGHSVSIHGRYMVVFGGMQRTDSTGPLVKTNDVWRLDLESMAWEIVETSIPKPRERYGHSQTALDSNNALIIGGCGGPNGLYTDMWLLKMMGEIWTWKQLDVRNPMWAPPDTWCHPTCRVGDHIVVLNRSKYHDIFKSCWRPPGPENRRQQRRTDRDENVNGRRGTLRQVAQEEEPSTSSRPNVVIHDTPRQGLSLSAFNTGQRPPRASSGKNRERQLELLRKMENLIRNRQGVKAQPLIDNLKESRQKIRKNGLCLYLLDITHALDNEPYVSWVQPRHSGLGGPEETLLYTLVQGKAELIMFGGIQKDSAFNVVLGTMDPIAGSTKVSNSLHFVSAPVDII